MKSAPIAITQVWTRHPHPLLCTHRKHRVPAASTMCSLQAPTCCCVPVAQRTTPFVARYDRRAAKRYLQKLDIGHVHKFGMERVRKFGIWARSELGIGTTFGGHSELGAFGPGAQLGRKNQPACPTVSNIGTGSIAHSANLPVFSFLRGRF